MRNKSNNKISPILKENLETLSKERDLLRSILNLTGNSLIAFFDPDFNFVFVNESYASTCGYKPEEMIGKNHFALYPGVEVEEIFRKVRDTGQAIEIHDRPFELPDQPQRGITYWNWTLSPIKDNDKVIGLVLSLNETTKHILAKKEIDKYRQLLETTINNVPAAICIIRGGDLKLEFINSAYQAVAPGKVMLGKTLNEIWPETNRDFNRICEHVLATGEPYHKEDELNMIQRDPGKVIEKAYFTWSMHRIQLPENAGWGILNSSWETTRRKQIEDELKKSRETYMELVTNARSMIFKMDPKGIITFVNEFALDFFGFKEDEILGKTPTQTITPPVDSFGKDLQVMVENIYADPDKYQINLNENIKKNGERVWVEWHNKALFDQKGNRTGHIAIGIDITDRIKAENDLKESEARFRSVLENSRDCIYRFNIQEGRFEYISRSAKDLIGYSPDELISLDDRETMKMVHPDSISVLREAQKLSEKTGTAESEYQQRSKSGEYRWISNRMSVIRDENGKPLYRDGILRDITKRKHIEIALNEAQKKLNIALDKGNIGIWEWNYQTDEAILDEKLELMFGLKPGTFGKTYAAFEALINEEDVNHLQAAIKTSLENDQPYETIFRLNIKNKTKYISSKGIVNRDKEGKPISMIGVCIDITGLKEGTEQLIAKLNEELLRSNKELEHFVYVASHDLQEPLRLVTSFTQLLERQYKDKLDDNAKDYIRFAVDGSKRMYDQLNGLLAYSRIHTKQRISNNVDLNKVLEIATNNLTLNIKEKEATIKSDNLPVVNADTSQMVQLFQNLISNSLKFSLKKPEIYVSSKSNIDHYLLSVKDNGIGIESTYFDRIFVLFQTLQPKGGEYGGFGIGLAICRRIVEHHGGRIWVESEPGKGSTFYFTILKT